jgi:hypothetical protein
LRRNAKKLKLKIILRPMNETVSAFSFSYETQKNFYHDPGLFLAVIGAGRRCK